jgi:tetratricopeptide (TPR) repeat protein
LRQIAGELDATHIVEGAVTRTEEFIRISIQLIDAATDSHVWAESIQRQFEEILDLQADIARRIAIQINESLGPGKQKRATDPVPVEAHEATLFGDYLWRTANGAPDQELRAVRCYDEALSLVPDYAPALEGKIRACLYLWVYGDAPVEIPPDESRRLLFEWADKILSVEPGNIVARVCRSAVMMFWDWNFNASRREVNQLLSDGISNLDLFHRIGNIETYSGNFHESMEWSEKAREIDPVSPNTNQGLVASYVCLGYYSRARKTLERMASMYPEYNRIQHSLAYVYRWIGEPELALKCAENVYIDIELPMPMGYAGRVFADLGHTE